MKKGGIKKWGGRNRIKRYEIRYEIYKKLKDTKYITK